MRKITDFLNNATPGRGLAVLAILMLIVAVSTVQAEKRRWVVKSDPDVEVITLAESDVGFLGVQLEEETDYEKGGARVTHVVEDSPAEAAGIEAGDIIIRFDKQSIHGPAALTKRIHSRKAGDDVQLTIVRDGSERVMNVELGERELSANTYFFDDDGEWRVDVPEFERRIKEQYEAAIEGFELDGNFEFDCDDDDDDCDNFFGFEFDEDMADKWVSAGDTFRFHFNNQRPMLGVQLVEATGELREFLGGNAEEGVLVSKVLSGSPAMDAGILVGDLIVGVAGESIADVDDLRDALDGRRGDIFDVDVIRDHREVSLAVTIPEPEEDETTGPRAGMDPRHIQKQQQQAFERMQHARHLQREKLLEAHTELKQHQQELVQHSKQLAQEALSRSREAAEWAHQQALTNRSGSI